jgi:hypothetical protein
VDTKAETQALVEVAAQVGIGRLQVLRLALALL